jgi:glycosyltransferase involved in cell wall biosynthesis/Tfp pilus assembly protein PilF
MKFSICVIEPEGYKYSHFLYDLCKYLCFTIEANGHECCMVKNKYYSDRINIILGAHNLKDQASVEQIKRAGKFVILQSEVLREGGIAGWPDQPTFHTIYVPLMQKASAVWHGLKSNEKYFKKFGIQAEMLPKFGYLPGLEEILHKKKKDIDFLYYGSVTPHRGKLINEIKKRGGNVVTIFDEAAIFRNDYIARTRVHLAPNQSQGINHITAKTLYLLNNRSIVVVERCHNQEWIEHCFPYTDTDNWADLCMETLNRPNLNQLADKYFDSYKKLDMSALFQPLLDKLLVNQKAIFKPNKLLVGQEAISKLDKLLVDRESISKPDKLLVGQEAISKLDKLLIDRQIISNIEPSISVERQKLLDSNIHNYQPLFPFLKEKVVPGMTSIIILTQKRLEYTKKCLKSIRKQTPEAYEIIFIDNGSTDSTVKWLQGQVRENRNYHLIENKENVGVATGRNQGINMSQGEFIALMDNDVVVCEGWLSGMLECLNRAPDTGIVGPMTNNCTGLQQVIDDTYPLVEYLDKYAERFREKYYHRRIPYRNVAGFCMLFKRSLMEKIGLLDERFDTSHFEDEDFCWRSALEGYKNVIAGDVFIHYAGRKESPGDRNIINKKWTLSMASPEGKKLAVLKSTEFADVLYQKGSIDQAIEALINCIKLTPDAKEIYYELTRIFIESKRFSEAWEVIGTMPEAAKNELKGLECTGYTKEGLGLDDEAADYVDTMLSLDGKYPAALNLRGVLAYKNGEMEKAQEYFQKAIDVDQGYGEAYTNLGVFYWGMDKKGEALQNLQKGFILSPTVPDVSSLYYSVVSSLGTFNDAEADYREASKLYPNNKNLAFLSIDILIRQGKFAEALIQIQDVLSSYGLDDGIMNAALAVREKIGPLQIEKSSKKGTLSLCMIVKNEEKYLVQCLKSVRDIADEIIMVDTGSTDKTIDIAKVFGAKLFDFPWTGDFAAARNHSLEQATGNWILILDGDEVLSPLDFKELKEIIHKKSSSPAAYSIATRNYITNVSVIGWEKNSGEYPEEAGTGWVVSKKVRLLTRSKDAVFSNPVHETLETSLAKAKIPVRPCNIVVHHYGKLDSQKDLKKGEEYYLLGKIKYENDPTNTKYVLELARQAQVLGKHEEAIELWLKLISLFQEAPPDTLAYQHVIQSTYGDPLSEIYTQLASAYMMLNRYEEALEAARKAIDCKIKLKEYVHVYVHCEIIAGSLTKAFRELEELLKTTPDYAPAVILMATIFCLEGKKEKVQESFQSLLQKNVNITPLLNTYARQLRTHGKKDEALLILNAIIENKISNAETMNLLNDLQSGKLLKENQQG